MMMPLSILVIENEDDRSFIGHLYMKHHLPMFTKAYKMAKNWTAAEEIVAEAAEKMVKYADKLQELEEWAHWPYIFRIVETTALDYFDRNKVQQKHCVLTGEEWLFDSVPHDERVEDRLMREATIEEFQAAMKKLRPEDQTLLRMKFEMKQSDEEIAKWLGVKPASVRTYICNARKRLEKKMKEEER